MGVFIPVCLFGSVCTRTLRSGDNGTGNLVKVRAHSDSSRPEPYCGFPSVTASCTVPDPTVRIEVTDACIPTRHTDNIHNTDDILQTQDDTPPTDPGFNFSRKRERERCIRVTARDQGVNDQCMHAYNTYVTTTTIPVRKVRMSPTCGSPLSINNSLRSHSPFPSKHPTGPASQPASHARGVLSR